MTKPTLRQLFKSQRTSLSAAEASEKSQRICANFSKNLLPKILSQNSNPIFSLYLASNNEASPQSLEKLLQQKNLPVCYPKIIAPNQPLEFILNQGQSFAASDLYPKILEPKTGTKIIPNILVMPLLAFDQHLSRLGMGGGFFDRTIAQLKKQEFEFITIGLAYEFQRSDTALPYENTDQKLDFVVTEKNIFSEKQLCVNLGQKKNSK